MTLVPVVLHCRAVSVRVGILKVVAAIPKIVPSPIIREAIAFPVRACNNDGFSVGATAGGDERRSRLGFRRA